MRITLSVLTLALVAMGCSNTRDYSSNGNVENYDFQLEGFFENYSELNDVQVTRSTLTGDIGPQMRRFDEPATVNGYHDDTWTQLEVIVTNDRGSAMALINVDGSVLHDDLAPGNTLTFRNYTSETPDTEVNMDGLVCAGQDQPYNWDFDQPIDEIEVMVEETPSVDGRRLNFVTYSGTDTASGYVDVMVEPN